MPKLYIRGLVKTVNAVRRDLSHPLSVERKKQLRRIADESVRQVDAILAKNAARLGDLPTPTRRAYQFLKSLDLDAVRPQHAAEPDSRAPGTVSLVGLKSFWDGILNQLAQPVADGQANILHDSITSASTNIKRHLSDNGLSTVDLTAQSRTARGWLAFFADRENYDAYVAAVARAKPIMEAAMSRVGGFEAPAIVHFRSLPGLFRYRGDRNGTRITLPTPMICFSEGLLRTLAETAFNGGSKQPIVETTFGDEYQSIQAQLEALCGVEERAVGVHHDLCASFERVNGRYFGGDLARPRLTWSQTFTGRKFGHYDSVRDTIMVSSTLDHADVPAFVVDFVMYHELLHKKLGVGWRNGRRAVHTPEFKAEERRFEQYAVVESLLATLGRGT